MFKISKYLLLGLLSILSMQTLAAPLVVYSGRSEALMGPILKQFQDETGIKLDIRYNTTPTLTTQLLTEGKDTPADVMLFQESGYLELLSKAGLLKPLDKTLLKQVSAQFRGTDGYWIGTSGRVRVLAYNTRLIKPEELPQKLADLSDKKWQGRLGWAPENASFQANVSALRYLWNEQKTEVWLKAMKELKPTVFPNNATQVQAVGTGEIAIGWVNHYYMHQLKQQNPKLEVANYHFPVEDAGNILMIAGGAIHQKTTQLEQAKQLLNYLVSEKGQTYFAQKTFEYPTRPGIATHADVTPLDKIKFAPVKQAWLADAKPTVALLKKLGIL